MQPILCMLVGFTLFWVIKYLLLKCNLMDVIGVLGRNFWSLNQLGCFSCWVRAFLGGSCRVTSQWDLNFCWYTITSLGHYPSNFVTHSWQSFLYQFPITSITSSPQCVLKKFSYANTPLQLYHIYCLAFWVAKLEGLHVYPFFPYILLPLTFNRHRSREMAPLKHPRRHINPIYLSIKMLRFGFEPGFECSEWKTKNFKSF